jgi:lysophospholipase L1-like esterase
VKKLGLTIGSVVFTLVLVEIVLRLTGLGMVRPEFQFDPRTGERLEAGALLGDRDLFWREPSDPSTAGKRPGNFIRVGDPVPPKGGKLRVITLGDSCTRLSRGGRPYSVALEQMLDPRRVEVFNASLPGYTSHQGLAWLEKQLLSWEPDLVIIYFGWNDHWRSTGTTDRQYAATLQPGRPRLLSLFQRRQSPPPLRVSLEEYVTNLRLMAEGITAAGGRSWVILAPDNLNAENAAFLLKNESIIPGDDPPRLHEEYREAARREAGVRAVDLAEVFTEIGLPKQLLMRDGIHPTDPGHAVIARVLADRVLKEIMAEPGQTPDPVVTGLTELAKMMNDAGDHTLAVATYERAIEGDPAYPKPRLGLAWLLATCPDAGVRSGAAARAALEPLREPMGALPDYLFVAAAAEAAVGRFETAMGMLDRALAALEIQNLGNGPFARTIRQARDKYQRGEAY